MRAFRYVGTAVMVAAVATAITPARAEQDAESGDAKSKSWVEDGIFPKSLQIPGTNVSVSFGGYVKVDFIQDLDSVGNVYEFKTDTIAIDGTTAADLGGQTTIHARESRLNVDFRSAEPKGAFRAFVEGDFFGDNGGFRLRHAYGEFRRVLAGQTWSTFMDVSARPLTLDFEGPDGEVFIRLPMIRYTMPIGKNWTWAIAVENPASQIDVLVPLTGTARNDMPDIPTYFRYEMPRGHVQIAGIVRQLQFDGQAGTEDLSTTGWGVNATFKFKVAGPDEVMGQVAYGDGIARYVSSLGGLNSDAVITSTSSIDPLTTTAVLVGYTHHWNKAFKSGIALALADLDTVGAQPGTTTSETRDARVNLIWTPYELVDFGFEALWGDHEVASGASGDAVRLQAAITYRFN